MRFLKLAAIFVGLTSTPALADWQFTKWGMTPEQVAAAAQGGAPISSGTAGMRIEGYRVGNVGTYKIGETTYRSVYYYTDAGLARVGLSTTADCAQISFDLKGVYGKVFSQVLGPAAQYIWHDRVKNNHIRFFAIRDNCSIDYSVLQGTASRGY